MNADDVKEAMAIIEEIDELADEVSEEGDEFAESVRDRAADIGKTIKDRDWVTQGQLDALENMRDGLSRWIH